MKVLVLLALGSMYFSGKFDPIDIVSASQVERMNKLVFEHDADLLRSKLKSIRSLHIQVDLSGRKGEAPPGLANWSSEKKVVLKTNIGPVVSTAGIDQIHVLAALQSEIPFEKLKALVGKNARVPRSWWTHLDEDCILESLVAWHRGTHRKYKGTKATGRTYWRINSRNKYLFTRSQTLALSLVTSWMRNLCLVCTHGLDGAQCEISVL